MTGVGLTFLHRIPPYTGLYDTVSLWLTIFRNRGATRLTQRGTVSPVHESSFVDISEIGASALPAKGWDGKGSLKLRKRGAPRHLSRQGSTPADMEAFGKGAV